MKKVKILVSVAGLADPDKAKLDERYARLRATLRAQRTVAGKRLSEEGIENTIREYKERDNYDAVPVGFKRDYGFKPGDEALIPADIAKKWQDSGICQMIEERVKTA